MDFSDYAAGSRSYFATDKPGKVSIEDGATVEEAKEAMGAAGFIAYDDFMLEIQKEMAGYTYQKMKIQSWADIFIILAL